MIQDVASSEDMSPMARTLSRVIRRYFLVMTICVLASGGISYFVATKYVTPSASATITLQHTPLPVPAGPTVYSPPTINFLSRAILSMPVMKRLSEKHAIQLEPDLFSRQFQVDLPYNTDSITVKLSRETPAETVAMLNDLAGIFIEHLLEHRKTTLEIHQQHVETVLQRNATQFEVVRKERLCYQERLNRENSEGGLGDNASRLREQLRTAESALDAAMLRRVGIDLRLQQLKEDANQITQEVKAELLGARTSQLEGLKEQFTAGSMGEERVLQSLNQLREFAKTSDPKLELDAWKTSFDALARNSTGPYADGNQNRNQLDEATRNRIAEREQRWREKKSRIEEMELEHLPYQSEIDLLTARVESLRQDLRQLVSRAAGVSENLLHGLDDEIEHLELERRTIQQQLSNIKQLKNSAISEVSVIQPATMEEIKKDSNKKKLFVLTFFASNLLLNLPIILWGLIVCREPPLARIHHRWKLPILGEKLAAVLRSHGCQYPVACNEARETIRLLALRIQQGVSRLERSLIVPEAANRFQQFSALRIQHTGSVGGVGAIGFHSNEPGHIDQRMLQLISLQQQLESDSNLMHSRAGEPKIGDSVVQVLAPELQPASRPTSEKIEFGTDGTANSKPLQLGIPGPDNEIRKVHGKVVLFSGLHHDESSLPLLWQIGACLAERGERVLIVDTTHSTVLTQFMGNEKDASNGSPSETIIDATLKRKTGLAEYLVGGHENWTELVMRTGAAGVDLIARGPDSFSGEAMASARLTRLLKNCRHEYTMTLIAAPSTKQLVDVEMLAARVDGLVLTVTDKSLHGNGDKAIDELLELGAPILGFVG
jgi:Mrp family chromosome partitioning ATPase